MARINTKLTLEAPEEISVPLVRADHLEMSNTFRLFFEVFLALTSSLVGVIISTPKVETIHWVFLSVSAVSSVIFLYKSYSAKKSTIAN